MIVSLLSDAMAHHVWATERLIDECASLTPEQLRTPSPGTYGSILGTLRHLVSSDGWYLSFFREQPAPIDEEAEVSLAELRSAIERNGAAWMEVLAGSPTPRRTRRSAARAGSSTPRPASGWRRSSTTAPITGARCAPP